MPPNMVKPRQEADWERAKEQAAKAGHKEDWPYVNAIFQKMIGKEAALSPAFLLALRYATSLEEAGPPSEWSGGVAGALGAEGRAELSAEWEAMSKKEQEEVMTRFEKSASVSRYDERFLATDGKWYLVLGNEEHDDYEDSTAYGPFPSESAADKYSKRFSNSGGETVDDSGTQPPPTKSPNGGKLVKPSSGSSYGGGYGGGRWAEESAKKLAAEDQYEETGMIKSNLSAIASKAQELNEMVAAEDNLEEWVQEKIAVCAEYMGVVHDHIKHSEQPPGENWTNESAKKLAAEFLSKSAGDGLADKIRSLAAHFLARVYARYHKGTLSFSEHGAKPWKGSETYNIPDLLASPRATEMSGDMQDFLKSLHRLLSQYVGQSVEVPSNIAIAWLTSDGDTDYSSFNLDSEYRIDTHYSRSGFYASGDKTAAEPPLHLAAQADEAVGQAYRDLVSLKLGFDTWEEIPSSVMPLYRWIGKAIASLVEARQMTTNVREIVKRKRY